MFISIHIDRFTNSKPFNDASTFVIPKYKNYDGLLDDLHDELKLYYTDYILREEPLAHTVMELYNTLSKYKDKCIYLIISNIYSNDNRMILLITNARNISDKTPMTISYDMYLKMREYYCMTETYNTIDIFTDGSAVPQLHKYGYAVYIPKCNYIYQRDISDENATNNICELRAILHALNLCVNDNNHYIIYSDSNYSINSIITWKLTKSKLNYELIRKCKDLYEQCKERVRFEHVFSHTKKTDYISLCNNIVDKLAVDSHK